MILTKQLLTLLAGDSILAVKTENTITKIRKIVLRYSSHTAYNSERITH